MTFAVLWLALVVSTLHPDPKQRGFLTVLTLALMVAAWLTGQP